MKTIMLNYAGYNLWANERMCGLLEKAGESLLDKEVASSFNSLRKTIYHIWDAETIWYKRLNGEPKPKWPRSAGFTGDFAEFRMLFLGQSQEFIDYVQAADEKFLTQTFEYFNTKGEPFTHQRWKCLMHCFNHSTYHRGQLVTMLRNVGFTDLASTDLITYFREQK